MPLTFPHDRGNVPERMTLRAFIEFADGLNIYRDESESAYDIEKVRTAAACLGALAHSKDDIIDVICGQLDDSRKFQAGNEFQPPTFLVHEAPTYTIRLVIWLPQGPQAANVPFSYEEAHDHNFDFFTVNFWGTGYTTDLYEYDYAAIKGFDTETVRLIGRGQALLSPGKTMFYRKSLDAHTQYPPDELSVSLNLIIRPRAVLNRQYEFDLCGNDLATLRMQHFDRYRQQRILFAFASRHGDGKSANLLAQIAKGNESAEIRALAWSAILSRENGDRTIRDAAMADPDPYVRTAIDRIWQNGIIQS